MNRDKLVREVARRTGVLLEATDLVCATFIDLIKETVEGGEEVTLNDFMRIYLREKDETTGTDFQRRSRMKVERRKVPWVKVSRKWRRQVIRKWLQWPCEPPKDNQMSIFDVIPKEE